MNKDEQIAMLKKQLQEAVNERDAALAAKEDAINQMIAARIKLIFGNLTAVEKRAIKNYELGDSLDKTAKRAYVSKRVVENAWKKIFTSAKPGADNQKRIQEILKSSGVI